MVLGDIETGFVRRRSSDTARLPVGSYRELAILLGSFRGVGAEGRKRKGIRMSDILVSNVESQINGRRNWEIAKSILRIVAPS